MLARLRAFLVTDPLIVLFTITMGTLSLGASVFDGSGRVQHRIARAWAGMLLWVSGVKVRVQGLEKLDPARSYVLVANHMSYMDTPLVLASIPLEFRFFAKRELFHIPFLGWHLRRAGHLPVLRGDARASLKVLTHGAKLIHDRKLSALLFPEGGRAADELRAFKEGAAYLAIKAGVPVVPIGIAGTRAVLPIGSYVVRPGQVSLRIGAPIETANWKLHDRSKLTELLKERISELMHGFTVAHPEGVQ
jgi:1-acyl-sn-glycerol-3-phosphate acyltransferase